MRLDNLALSNLVLKPHEQYHIIVSNAWPNLKLWDIPNLIYICFRKECHDEIRGPSVAIVTEEKGKVSWGFGGRGDESLDIGLGDVVLLALWQGSNWKILKRRLTLIRSKYLLQVSTYDSLWTSVFNVNKKKQSRSQTWSRSWILKTPVRGGDSRWKITQVAGFKSLFERQNRSLSIQGDVEPQKFNRLSWNLERLVSSNNSQRFFLGGEYPIQCLKDFAKQDTWLCWAESNRSRRWAWFVDQNSVLDFRKKHLRLGSGVRQVGRHCWKRDDTVVKFQELEGESVMGAGDDN